MAAEGEGFEYIKDPDELASMSVEELQEYRAQLKAELKRVTAEIEKKEKYRDSLDSVFKS